MSIIILLTLLLLWPLTGSADWPMFMGNHYLTGNNDEIVPDKNFMNWNFTGPSYLYYPVPHKGLVLVNCLDKYIYALDKVTSEVVWKCNLNYPAVRSCAAYKDYVFITAGDYVFCLDIRSGAILWSRKEGVSVQLSTPIVADDILYYGSRKFFYSRHIRNGRLIWENKDVNIYGGTPIYWNKRIYFISKDFTRKQSRLLCLATTNGLIQWQQELPSDANVYTPVVYDKHVFISSYNTLYSFDALNGSQAWKKEFKDPVTSNTVFANDTLFLSVMDGNIYTLDPADGGIKDSFSSFNKSGAQFVLVGETLYIPNEKGEVHAFHYPTRSLRWKFKTAFSNQGATMSAEDGRLYLATANILYSLSPGRLPPAASYIASSRENPKASLESDNGPEPGPGTGLSSPSPAAPPQPVEKKMFDILLKDIKDRPVEGEVVISQDQASVRYRTQNGRTRVEVEKEKGFSITAQAPEYFIKSETIPADEKRKNIEMNLEPIVPERSYVFNNIEFEYNRAELTPAAMPALEAVASLLREKAGLEIEIRGYTDNIGGKEYNLKLSQMRAEKVKEYLVKQGVLDQRLRIKGFGLENPVASNDTEEGRARNRRTEFYILK